MSLLYRMLCAFENVLSTVNTWQYLIRTQANPFEPHSFDFHSHRLLEKFSVNRRMFSKISFVSLPLQWSILFFHFFSASKMSHIIMILKHSLPKDKRDNHVISAENVHAQYLNRHFQHKHTDTYFGWLTTNSGYTTINYLH